MYDYLWCNWLVCSDTTGYYYLFGGGPAGVFGNSTGGWRGAILAGVVAGLLLSFGQALTVGVLSTTVADFARWSNDFDYSVFPAFFKWILQLFA
ncbi:MAG: PTS transporter subunit IIC [Thomasclavelia ramosa]